MNISCDDDSGPARYELTVVGSIGAVWRAAIKPHRVGTVETCTILHTESPAGGDLVDLLGFLEARGVDAQEVHRLAPANQPQWSLSAAMRSAG